MPACKDTLDNDGDGLVDLAAPGAAPIPTPSPKRPLRHPWRLAVSTRANCSRWFSWRSALGTDAWSASVSRCLARERGTAVSDSVIYATPKRLTDKGLLAMERAQPTERRRGRRRSSGKYWCGLTTITQDVRDAL